MIASTSFAIGCVADDAELSSQDHVSSAGVNFRTGTEPQAPELKWAIPSDEDPAAGDPMKIVHNQRARLHEYAELTAEAMKLRPIECDTEMRSEVEGEMVPLTVYLEEQPFDFRRFRNAKDKDARFALIEERKRQLQPFQEPVGVELEKLGGFVTNYEYVLNAIDVDIPVCNIVRLESLQGVLGVETMSSDIPSYVDGLERRAAHGLPTTGHTVFNGSQGTTRSGESSVLFGVIESDNDINSAHSSFNLGITGTRIRDTDRCAFWFPSFRCINSATGTASSHGTIVSSIILSDLSLGQSSVITNPTEQHRRSGIAPRARLHYYSTNGNTSGTRTAVKESSLEDGADIINMSLSSHDPSDFCLSPTRNGTREALEAARDAGVVAISSAGNNGNGGYACSVAPPATYSTTIAAGGTGDALALSDLDAVTRYASSSFGSTEFDISGGRSVSSPLVDVVANNCHKYVSGAGVDGETMGCGTSFSAPSISGIVGLIKHWIAHRGGLPQSMADDPVAIRAILSLMGDGRTSGIDALGARDSHFGYGNVRFVNLDADTGSNGSWGIHRVSVTTGSVHEWNIGAFGAESSNLKGFKAVAIADRDNYSESPDIKFQLIDKCPSSGSQEILTATRSALQWRLRSWESLTSYLLDNRCLWLRATTEAATSATNLYVAWVLYSNDRIHHDASNQ